jgi:hypothetical protein
MVARTLTRYIPTPPPMPLRVITLDCIICEEPTRHMETESAFVCSVCKYELTKIVMNTPPMMAFL